MSEQNITHRIRNLMQNNEITAYKICKDCSISDGHFAEVMKYYPQRNFTVDQLAKLAKYFGVTTDWLIWGDEKNRDKEIEKLKSEIVRLEKLSSKSIEALMIFNDIEDQIEKYKVLKKEIADASTVKGYESSFSKKIARVLAIYSENVKSLKNSKK